MGHNLKYGLLIGLISVAFNLALLLIDYHLLLGSWVTVILLMINLAVLFIAGFELRKLYDDYLPFRDAFLSTLTIIAIGLAISTVYSILVYNVFAPDIAEELHQEVVNQTANLLENIGMDDEAIDTAMIQAEAVNPYSVKNLLISYFSNLLGGAVLALIIGAIVKKKKPDFE